MKLDKDRRVYNDNYQIYLDRICSSPHIPKPTGGLGYSSKKTLPNLEHTGIYSSFNPKSSNVTDTFGRITKEFKWNACIKTGKIEKQNVKIKYHQPFFKSNHSDFLNKVLVDMEDTRSFKVERNRRQWMEGKNNTGFSSQFTSYENALALEEERMSSNTPLGYKFDSSLSNESDIKTVENSAFLTTESFVELPSIDYNKTVSFYIEKEDSIFPGGPVNNRYNSSRPTTSISKISSKSSKSSRPSTATFTGESRRKRNAVNRMALFECLLDTTEPPTTPIKRYGSFSPFIERTITTASSLDYRGSELVKKGVQTWSTKSIKRANTGDKQRTTNIKIDS